MVTKTGADLKIKVADAVWVATALLHQANPRRDDFTVSEIVDRAMEEFGGALRRQSLYQHAYQHCVANQPRNSGGYRMLFQTGENTRRLFQQGDPVHPSRRGKTLPDPHDLPEKYLPLLKWYTKKIVKTAGRSMTESNDPILGLRGRWKGLWKDEGPDEYVKRLREGWE